MTEIQETAGTHSMLVITDEQGNVVAAAHKGEGSVPGLTVAVSPLPGQTIHEIEVPEPIARLRGRDFHFFITQARFEIPTAKLKFPEMNVRHHHED
jgi:hypothetical protein